MSEAFQPEVDIEHIALVGNYLPRQCGIATFTKDLRDGIAGHVGEERAVVLAMDDEKEHLHYPGDVGFQISMHQRSDYRSAAEMLNINQINATIVQHEFGIFGGQDGAMLLNLMRRLRMPVITTLHTVLKDPTRSQMKVIEEITRLSDRLVVMSEMGEQFLKEIYQVPPHKISFIPHGIHDVPFIDPSFYKDQFGLEGRTTILTFGLLSRGKGIETMLDAMPRVVQKHPDVMYVVLGATHPNVLRQEGEAYRNMLEQKVLNLGLRDNVMFHNRFVSLEELVGYIGAADLYVTPYLNEAQITSGTLAYAMGAGKAVVSTPYWYAEEMLEDSRGRLFGMGDSEALAEHVLDLLDNQVERNAIRKRAYMHCRKMVWQEVAKEYLNISAEAIQDRREKPRPVHMIAREVVASDAVPDIDLGHLRTMTDGTGIYQHAIYTIPDRNHGYCIDDNARALIAALRHYKLFEDDSILPLVSTYLSFVHGAFNPDLGRFRNFMSFDRRWLEEQGSDDSHARTLWSLGETVALAPNDGVLGYATRLFNEALPVSEKFQYPRSLAFTLIGLHAYLRRFGGDSNVRRVRDEMARRLFEMFETHATEDWPWCEDMVTYDNGKLSHALILCGQWLPDGEMLEMGLKSLMWLLEAQTNEKGDLSLIGCNGWYQKGKEKALFDQQPIEVMALVDACSEAYRCTGEEFWGREIHRCLGWFLGRNDLNATMYDFRTGGCRDGLSPQGANQNEGAESTLSWLISLITTHELQGRHEGPDD